MRFEFATAPRIVFGEGTVRQVPEFASGMGKRSLVLTGSNPKRASRLIDDLQKAGISVVTYSVSREPTTEIVLEGTALARNEECDLIIAMGGGSVIDAGKSIAAMRTNPGDLFDYLEVIGRAQTIQVLPAPYIAIPTSAGTGTEVTKNAVIISKPHKVKVSMRSGMMLPRIVVVDPELTYTMPPEVTASTGLDALTQLIEAYTSGRANPLTDGICREGLMRAARSLKTTVDNGNNASAREDMSLASLFSGIALANAGLGAVHGFAAPIGGQFDAPHGLICARLLPIVMKMNILALSRRKPDSSVRVRYDDIGKILTQDPQADALRGVLWVEELCSALKISSLASIGLSRADIHDIVHKAMRASSMKGNPIELTEEELKDILEKAI